MLTLAWVVLGIAVSYQRSFWGDEMTRIDQFRLGLIEGLKQLLLKDPSPFSPGETVLIWIFGKLFSGFVPMEVWGRLSGVLWAAGVVALSVTSGIRYLPWFVFFSVSLIMLGAEMRCYGSLMFAGALSFIVLWRELRGRGWNGLIWFTLVFTHIYGICFVGFACFLKRRWMQAAFAGIYVGALLAQYKMRSTLHFGNASPQFGEIARQSLGALGNPHKVTYLFSPLFCLGFVSLLRSQAKRALLVAVLIVVCVGGPLVATLKSGFPFLPRQVLGGMFVYLATVSLGLNHVCEWLRSRWKQGAIAFLLAVSVIAFGAVRPWVLCLVFSKPPFPNQPIHRYREIAKSIVDRRLSNVLFLRACDSENFTFYVSRFAGTRPESVQSVDLHGNKVSKRCWKNGPCVYILEDMRLCSSGEESVAANTPGGRLLDSTEPRFDLVVHDFEHLRPLGVPALRAW